MNSKTPSLQNFFVAGISYRNASAEVRGRFSISAQQYENILACAASYGIEELFVLSTCNRTEIYALAKDEAQVIELLCSETSASKEEFVKLAYIKNAHEAITHLYDVGCGLDSQILGDYEIVGQLKQAVKFSRERGCIHTFLDRLVSSVFRTSKNIKTNTALSGGSVSVSFAAVKYLQEKTHFTKTSKILVLGVGKIGRNTCKNLVDVFGATSITVMNRSEEKAITLAEELNIHYAPVNELALQLQEADIILLATNAVEPVLLKSDLTGKGDKLIIDLSIPCNVEAGTNELPNISLVHLDQLSKLKDENLKKRQAEVPKAKKIIDWHISSFIEWHETRRNLPELKVIKSTSKKIHTLPVFASKAYSSRILNAGEKISACN